jgi:hypothetical protein
MHAISKLRAVARQLPIAIVAFAMIGNAMADTDKPPPKTSFSTDFSDAWYNAQEPGRGAQLVQTGSFIFATVYDYALSTLPTWFSGELDVSAANTFTGPLYVTTGPYFGGPYNATPWVYRQAGTMQFRALSPDTGVLDYTVDGVAVTMQLQRQPLTLDDYNGTFASVATQTTTNCTNAANNGSQTTAQIIQISQTAQTMSAVQQHQSGDNCQLTGAYSQLGRNGRFDGTYVCTSGDSGMFIMFEMNNHVRQFNGRTAYQSNTNGCLSTGRVTGVIPN